MKKENKRTIWLEGWMRNVGILAGLLGLSMSALGAAELARGYVYHDLNGNGVRDAEEPGLASVRVSNGKDISRTDEEGRYTIPVAEGQAVFVLKPGGYRTPVDGLNLPRFYYLHEPDGTPDEKFLYKGIAPTGPLPESIDFALYEQEEPDQFTVAMVGDPQGYNTDQFITYGRTVIPELKDSGVDFAIALGDLVGNNLNLFKPYNEANALTGFPWYNVIGNHDINFMSPDDRYADATFRQVFGPSTYAFQYGPVHFIILNNVYWEGFTQLRQDGWPRRGQYAGRVRREQLQFIENYLLDIPKEERVVLCSHIPMIRANHKVTVPGFDKILKLLSDYPHTVSFSGHTHTNNNFFSEDGHHHHIVSATSGSWYFGPKDEEGIPFSMQSDGTPRGYAVVSFDKSEYSVRYKAIGRSDSYQMRISAPDVVLAEETGRAEIWANVFNGSEKSIVEMRIKGHTQWQVMEHRTAVDPAYQEIRDYSLRLSDAGGFQPLPAPSENPHMWYSLVPAGTPSGLHLIEVRSNDMFGHTDHASRPLRVRIAGDGFDQLDANNSLITRDTE